MITSVYHQRTYAQSRWYHLYYLYHLHLVYEKMLSVWYWSQMATNSKRSFVKVEIWCENELPRVRLELTTLGLWDLRAAYCATEACEGELCKYWIYILKILIYFRYRSYLSLCYFQFLKNIGSWKFVQQMKT